MVKWIDSSIGGSMVYINIGDEVHMHIRGFSFDCDLPLVNEAYKAMLLMLHPECSDLVESLCHLTDEEINWDGLDDNGMRTFVFNRRLYKRRM